MTRTYRIKIPNWRPATLNSLIAEARAIRRHGISKLKKLDKEMVQVYAFINEVPPQGDLRRRISIEIELYAKQHEADEDAYWKSLLDACVHARILKDDSRKWREPGTVTYLQRRGTPHTTIVVEDLAS